MWCPLLDNGKGTLGPSSCHSVHVLLFMQVTEDHKILCYMASRKGLCQHITTVESLFSTLLPQCTPLPSG